MALLENSFRRRWLVHLKVELVCLKIRFANFSEGICWQYDGFALPPHHPEWHFGKQCRPNVFATLLKEIPHPVIWCETASWHLNALQQKQLLTKHPFSATFALLVKISGAGSVCFTPECKLRQFGNNGQLA